MTTPEANLGLTPSASMPPAQASNWLDQDPILRELWQNNEKPAQIAEKLGRSIAAVMTRAARLGLPRRSAPGRKPGYQRKQSEKNKRLLSRASAETLMASADSQKADRATESNMKLARICLMCLKRFPSEGRHNRICPSCKSSAEYNTGNSIPDIFKVDA